MGEVLIWCNVLLYSCPTNDTSGFMIASHLVVHLNGFSHDVWLLINDDV